MSAPFESFLARIYVDGDARARFLADPRGEACRAGLTVAEEEALARIDRTGLTLAARSFERKRARHLTQRHGWRTRIAALLDRLSR